MFIVICAPRIPGKKPGCGLKHISLTYAFRGLLNIPNQSYETHMSMRIGEKNLSYLQMWNFCYLGQIDAALLKPVSNLSVF